MRQQLRRLKIEILSSADGQSKRVVCSGGYGSAATRTFIRHHVPLLREEIQQARVIRIQLPPSPLSPSQFPEIGLLCTPQQITEYIGDGRSQALQIARFGATPLQAAQHIMHGLFPTYSLGYIQRRSRR